MSDNGSWYGRKCYFGLHYDLHPGAGDTRLGLHCGPKELTPALKRMDPDWVQTDCKGHPGYVSWFSQTPEASVPPKLRKDALRQWRKATAKLGLPLHCHYSGIWDKAAGAKHPEWCVVGPGGEGAGAPFGQNAGSPTRETMCPRSAYLDELMIPQMIELVDRYGVDGFWIDGDLWAASPCYCEKCTAAFVERTGLDAPPVEESDPHWPAWWTFTLESFYEYVTRYCDAVHAHAPDVKVCSNWLQTFRNPGEPTVPTDWISGDNAHVWGLDNSRCEARFLSTRGKPWDIMLWAFYCSGRMGDARAPWTPKPLEMLMQEAAVLLSFGGNVQIYQRPHAHTLRDGRLSDWRMKQLGELGRWIRKRRTLCQDTETIPQVAVLHSEHHLRTTTRGKKLMWSVDVAPVVGAVCSILETHRGVDVLDEWALGPRLDEFPAVVAPERNAMSDEMVDDLKDYVRNGGRLLVTGADAGERFGLDFLGATKGKTEENARYYLPAGGSMFALHSDTWRLTRPRKGARGLGQLGRTELARAERLADPAAVINKVGRGKVLWAPFGLFRAFHDTRYPLIRVLTDDLLRELAGRMDVEIDAPTCIDVALRRKKDGRRIVHLVNRASGIPNQPNNGAVDEIPPVGPVTIEMKCPERPEKVHLALEAGTPEWTHSRGRLRVTVPSVRIHAAVVVKP